MGLFLMLVFFALAAFVLALAENARLGKMEREMKGIEVVPVKTCPPHKWRYAEVKDTEGNTVKWKIVCDVPGCPGVQMPDRPSNGEY